MRSESSKNSEDLFYKVELSSEDRHYACDIWLHFVKMQQQQHCLLEHESFHTVRSQ